MPWTSEISTMPIDLRRFEHCSDQKRLYLQGYKDDELLERRLEVALALRRTVHSLRNQREQLVARRRKGLVDDDCVQASLPELEEQVKVAAASLHDSLWQLPNWIDSDLAVATNSTKDDSSADQSTAAPLSVGDCDDDGSVPPPEDPLFCANCYDEIRSGASKTTPSTTVLVGPGIRLSHVLHEYMVGGIMQALDLANSAVTHWNLPPSIESVPPILDNDMAHYACALLRPATTCERGKIPTEPPAPMDIPAWLTMLRIQSGTYWDRQLPRVHIVSTTTTMPTKPCDDREAARIQSWSDRGRHGGHDAKGTTMAASLWHQRLAVSEQVQLLSVTGPSLEADSRPLQVNIMQQVRNMFQALVQQQHHHHHHHQQHSSRHTSSMQPPTVQLYAVPAEELLPMESSRLVVQGYLSSPSRPVCLAYLSNLQDYCSTTTAAATASVRGCDLRHGTTKEGLHVLHGTICSMAETMEWLSHNRARHHAIAVPPVLTERPGSALPPLLMYTRRVVIHPKGKRSVQDIVVPPANNTRSQSIPQKKLGPTDSPTQKGLHAPSIERIRGEALSSPFGFLPFHHR
jgi:hypothetical protein